MNILNTSTAQNTLGTMSKSALGLSLIAVKGLPAAKRECLAMHIVRDNSLTIQNCKIMLSGVYANIIDLGTIKSGGTVYK